jgi:hypothetical protein
MKRVFIFICILAISLTSKNMTGDSLVSMDKSDKVIFTTDTSFTVYWNKVEDTLGRTIIKITRRDFYVKSNRKITYDTLIKSKIRLGGIVSDSIYW